jgi:hypothetical protein
MAGAVIVNRGRKVQAERVRYMQRFFISAVNCGLLVLVLLAVPEVSSARFWHWQLSSVSAAQSLRFWALVLAVAINASGALFLVKGRKDQRFCWLWAAVFAALVGGEFAYECGYFNFNWLKRGLLWVMNKV